MKLNVISNSNGVIEKREIDYPIGFHLISYSEKILFDLLSFNEPPYDVSVFCFNEQQIFPPVSKQALYTSVLLQSPYFSFNAILKNEDNSLENKKILQDLSDKVSNLLEERPDEPNEQLSIIKKIVNVFDSSEFVLYFVIDLNNAFNTSMITKAFKNSCKTVFVLEKKPVIKIKVENPKKIDEKKVETEIAPIAETKPNKKKNTDVSKEQKTSDVSKPQLKEKISLKRRISSFFETFFKPFWGNYLFLFLHSILITSFFLLGIPLLNDSKFLAIGILFICIGVICFILAFTIGLDFSNEISNAKNKKSRASLIILEVISFTIGLGFGVLLFYALAANNVLIKLKDFNLVSVIILAFIFVFMYTTFIAFKPVYLLRGKINEFISKIFKKRS